MSLLSIEDNFGIALDVHPSKVHGKAVCFVQGDDHHYSTLDISPEEARKLATLLLSLANKADPNCSICLKKISRGTKCDYHNNSFGVKREGSDE